MGKPFPAGIKTKPDETVVFSWIVFKSRAHRDKVNKKEMESIDMDPKTMPFDPQRMMYGGFKSLVEA